MNEKALAHLLMSCAPSKTYNSTSPPINNGRGILMTKENVYDEQISPLVRHIIDICRAQEIALLLSALPEDEDERELFCTTILPGTDEVSCEKFVQALSVICPPGRPVMHMPTTHANGSQTLTAII
jgi:hypothetical protein